MDEMVIAVVSGAAGVAFASLVIWLIVRAINKREVLWIVFTVLPFALIATIFGFLFVVVFAGGRGWLSF